ncbi:DUF222 domain-containing protein [Nocardioides islandensis]|uniref:DUF222 domain-containing protein n=1 Tax=Nocardioides islandensis TaxID=433663 RepID=A0A930VF32_9ACTN|nr:HNH endonuclease signature motif containing protein [Nocardioides islandensis]MBF4763625.1 DUF222 domain-containing protein [Nocardioides islandensis]
MSSRSETPIAAINAALDDLAGVDPTYQTVAERKARLTAISQVIAKAEADRLRVLAVSDDIAIETGARSTAHWLAAETRDGIGQVRVREKIARIGGEAITAAMSSSGMNVAQAREIVDALERLPKNLDPELRDKGEAYLIGEAAHFGPPELRRLGARLLEVIAPEDADEAEYQRLLAEDRRARAVTRLTFRDRGDGSGDLHARMPMPVLNRLRTYLESYTAPRRGPLGGALGDEVDQLPAPRRRGEAFCALLENLPTNALPKHGGTATTVMVMIDLETLRSGTGTAETSTGDRLTAEQTRRLACQAGIIPVVLGGKGEILDLGRSKRLFTGPQRKAMALRDRQCTADGCTIPAAWCEAHHHQQPWSRGGKTNLADGKLLCPFHHHRAHDPAWATHHHPNGSTTFHRRT